MWISCIEDLNAYFDKRDANIKILTFKSAILGITISPMFDMLPYGSWMVMWIVKQFDILSNNKLKSLRISRRKLIKIKNFRFFLFLVRVRSISLSHKDGEMNHHSDAEIIIQFEVNLPTWPISLSPSVTRTASRTSSISVLQQGKKAKWNHQNSLNDKQVCLIPIIVVLPEESSSTSRSPSFESRSGAPYHFLNLGPPT